MKNIFLALFLFLIPIGIYGQTINDTVKLIPISYFEADNAFILEKEGKKIVITENASNLKYGVKLILIDTPNKYIEVHDEKKPFPPKVLRPYADNEYLIEGEVGQRFYVSIRSDNFPTWIEVVIQKTGPPNTDNPTDPPVDPPADPPALTDLDKIIKEFLPNDPITQKVIVDSYKVSLAQIKADSALDLAKSKEMVSRNRGAALLTLPSLSTSWNIFLLNLETYVSGIKTKEDYIKFLDYLISKLNIGTSTSFLSDDLLLPLLNKAKEEDKYVMLIFTGNSWCPYCQLLEKEVLATEAFKQYSKQVILYKAEYDRSLTSENEYDRKLLEKYKNIVTSYPTVLVLDQNGKVLTSTGYIRGGVLKWLNILKTQLEAAENG